MPSLARKRSSTPKATVDSLDGLYTVSRPALMVKGDDAAFRQFVSNLFAAADIVWRARGRLSRKFGLTANQFAILLAVRHFHSGTSVRQLADHLKMAAANVTKEVNILAARYLLAKATDPRDSRALSITLTPKARRLLRALLPISRDINDIQYQDMTAADMFTISNACARIIEAEDQILRLIATVDSWN
jgi:MarR family transcriptional regulator, organic hydroperoxide resistance regulator